MNAEKRMEDLKRDEQVRADLNAKARRKAAEQERIRQQAAERAWRRRLAREQQAASSNQGHDQKPGPSSSSCKDLKGGGSTVDASTTDLDQEMLDRLQSYGILLKKDVTRHQALGLIAEELVRRLGQIWHELFPDSQMKDVAMSDQEVRDLVHEGK